MSRVCMKTRLLCWSWVKNSMSCVRNHTAHTALTLTYLAITRKYWTILVEIESFQDRLWRRSSPWQRQGREEILETSDNFLENEKGKERWKKWRTEPPQESKEESPKKRRFAVLKSTQWAHKTILKCLLGWIEGEKPYAVWRLKARLSIWGRKRKVVKKQCHSVTTPGLTAEEESIATTKELSVSRRSSRLVVVQAKGLIKLPK